MENKLRNAFVTLVVGFVCLAHVAMAADDGQTQPKLNTAATYYPTTPVEIIPTTIGSGKVVGINCPMYGPPPIVKFYVNGGAAQSVELGAYLPPSDQLGYEVNYTGWVPLNVRFTSSIRVTIQKATPSSAQSGCTVSWGLD